MAKTKAVNKAGVEFYEPADGGWRWRLRSANGNIVADSGESYRRISGATKGFAALVKAVSAVAQPADAPAPMPRKPRAPKTPPSQPLPFADATNDANAELNRQDSEGG